MPHEDEVNYRRLLMMKWARENTTLCVHFFDYLVRIGWLSMKQICSSRTCYYLFFDEVDHRLVVDEVDVLEPNLFVRVDRLLLLESVSAQKNKHTHVKKVSKT